MPEARGIKFSVLWQTARIRFYTNVKLGDFSSSLFDILFLFFLFNFIREGINLLKNQLNKHLRFHLMTLIDFDTLRTLSKFLLSNRIIEFFVWLDF